MALDNAAVTAGPVPFGQAPNDLQKVPLPDEAARLKLTKTTAAGGTGFRDPMAADAPGSTPNLNAALVAAVKATPWVEWTKPEPKGGINYEYLSEEDIVKQLRKVLPEHGISVIPRVMSVIQKEVYNSRNGARMVNLLISVRYRISHTSGEWIEGEALGEGSDVGDKSANKAMTAAFKYFLREAFLIAGGNDPDKVSSEESARAMKQKNQPVPAGKPAQGQTGGQSGGKQQPTKTLDERCTAALAGIAKATDHDSIKATAKKAGNVFKENKALAQKVYNACAARATILFTAEVGKAEDLETVEAIVKRAEADKIGTDNLTNLRAAAEKKQEAIAGASGGGDDGGGGSEPLDDAPVPLDF